MSRTPEMSVWLHPCNKHFIFPLNGVVFAPAGLLISSDVSLFIFKCLDSSKKRDTIWAKKEATEQDVVMKMHG